MTSIASKEGKTRAGGRALAYQLLQPAEAKNSPWLVFLHEGLGSIGQWKDFPEALCQATGLPALIYDRWGFGGSDPLELPRPDDYLQREAEVFLPQLLEALGIERPILIGHSDGGSIALLFAAAFPDEPSAIITEAAHVFVEEVTLAGIREAEALWSQIEGPLSRYHGEKTELVFRGWTETWLRPSFKDWNIEDRLPEITAPLLVLQGAEDQYGTEKQVEAITQGASGPAQGRLIPNCQHIPHREAREATLEAMSAFIEKVTARR